MEIDRFGFIEDMCRIPKEQELILLHFPFPWKAKEGRNGESSSQEPGYLFTLTEPTGIMMMSIPETEEGVQEEEDEEGDEEYHTPPENSSAVPSSDEADGVGARARAVVEVERVADLGRDDEMDVSQGVSGLNKGGEGEKIRALREKEGSQGSSRSKLKAALGLLGSCFYPDGGNVPDLEALEHGRALKEKAVLARQEYLARKLSKPEKKLGSLIGNEHKEASDSGEMEVDPEIREIRILEGGRCFWGVKEGKFVRQVEISGESQEGECFWWRFRWSAEEKKLLMVGLEGLWLVILGKGLIVRKVVAMEIWLKIMLMETRKQLMH